MKRDRQKPEPKIELLQQIRSLVFARSGMQRRSRSLTASLSAEPVEICEPRAMLSAAPIDPVPVTYLSISSADLDVQIANTLNFVNSNSSGGEVVVFVNGEIVELDDLVSGLADASDSAANVPDDSQFSEGDGDTIFTAEDFFFEDINDSVDGVGAAHGDVVTAAPDSETPLNHASGFPSSDATATVVEPVDVLPPNEAPHFNSTSTTTTPVFDDEHDDGNGAFVQDSVPDAAWKLQPAASSSQLGGNSSNSESVRADNHRPQAVPTTITTVIRTNSGILVLHQTSADRRDVVTNSSTFKFVQRLILSLSREIRQSKSDSRLPNPTSTIDAPPATLVNALDTVFADSDRLFQAMEEPTLSSEFSLVTEPETSEAVPTKHSEPAEFTHPEAFDTKAPQTSTSTDWSDVVRQLLFGEAESATAAGLTGSAVEHNADATNTGGDQELVSGHAEFYKDLLGTQVFWSPVLRDEEQSEAVLLADFARHAAQPHDGSSDLRNSELYRSLIFLSSNSGESAYTIPRRLPEHPPEVPELVCLATVLLYVINPRGPPTSQQVTGFSRQEANRLHHEMLKHSIAPRSPSMCFFA